MGQKQKLIFPENFLWGAAISTHQTEGGNANNDWWAFEHSAGREKDLRRENKNPEDYYSGAACDFYNRYEEDFDLASQLRHNTVRFGVEWSRVEPREGFFDEAALDHYEKMLQAAQVRGLTVFLTLHHYANPLWFADRGAFTKKENVDYFVRYAKTIAARLGQYVDFWLTINEPKVYTFFSYAVGTYPPRKRNLWLAAAVAHNLIRAHNRSARELKNLTAKPVSMAFQLSDIQPKSILSRPLIGMLNYFVNDYFLSRTIDHCDFIGVNYYFHHHVGWFGERKMSKSEHEKNDLDWGIHPEGIERVLMRLHKKYNKPMYITENGIADAKDNKREKFIVNHLAHIHKAIQQGADVQAYLYWSLTDNFEWLYGFGPRFGLIEIDREDGLKRAARPSALKFAEICKNNYLEY